MEAVKALMQIPKSERAKLKYDDPMLDAWAVAAEKEYGLKAGTLLAIKNFGERSDTLKNGKVYKSGKQAAGVMQFVPGTMKDYPHDPLDPVESIDAAGRYVAKLVKQFKGDYNLVFYAYNWGPGNVRRKGIDKAPEETINFVKRVMPAFQKEQVRVAELEKAKQESTFKSAEHYTDEELESFDQQKLLAIRKETPNGPQQNRVAGFEHKAFNYEETKKSLTNVPGLLIDTPLYTLAKLVGAHGGRSDASFDQMRMGFEGIAKAIKERFEEEGKNGKEGAVQEGGNGGQHSTEEVQFSP